MDRQKILVVDDENRMRKLVKDFLQRENFEVLEAGDGSEALDVFFAHQDIALMILDVMMPKMDGWQVCREIRSYSKVPIIMLTARSDEKDELQGFDLGVDEYISKPFSPKILVARVEAILRRTGKSAQENEVLDVGGIHLDKAAHMVEIDGRSVDLSYKEFELLTYFMENRGIALSREKILNNVWNYDYFGDARTIDTHVKKLRSKLGDKGELIKTIWGMGISSMHKKEKKTAKRTSIRKQFAGIFIGLMAGTILLCWFLNSGFLQKYYISNKKAVLMRMYEELGEAVANGEIDTDEYQLSLQQQCSKYNLSLLVLNANSEVVADSGGGSEFLKQQLLQHLFALSGEKYEIMENGNNYIVARVSDSRAQMEYIESWGILTGGYFFIVRSALEGIRDSAKIANTFLASVGIFSAIISGIVIWIVSRRVTTPILQLADISERMCHLDFEARYSGNSKNEIGILGENINQLSDTLEHTISELKTANNELKKDIQKKEEIDQMRREFLANVSHELKTPIALIQGYAEGLLEDVNSDPESRKFYCDVIVDEAAKMNNMVKKLLTLNQLEAGNDVVSMERFDITALVHNYLQSADLLAKQNGISVHMDQTKEIYVWSDEFKIEEVLMNYFSNAVNHCEKEKVIEVKIEEMDGHARVSVFNTGMPIPEDSLPHLWEKFYKVDKARTREYGGSGIGLSIVKAIMESMNQKYGVINYENGVRFWFELELAGEESEITPAISEKNS